MTIYSVKTGLPLFPVNSEAEAWKAINDPMLIRVFGAMFYYQQ